MIAPSQQLSVTCWASLRMLHAQSSFVRGSSCSQCHPHGSPTWPPSLCPERAGPKTSIWSGTELRLVCLELRNTSCAWLSSRGSLTLSQHVQTAGTLLLPDSKSVIGWLSSPHPPAPMSYCMAGLEFIQGRPPEGALKHPENGPV